MINGTNERRGFIRGVGRGGIAVCAIILLSLWAEFKQNPKMTEVQEDLAL